MTAASQGIPSMVAPLVDPTTGQVAPIWSRFFNALWLRTGSQPGVDATAVSAAANAAQATATGAQGTANAAVKRAGDTMTGALILSGAPTVALGAVTKAYADGIAAGTAMPSNAAPIVDGTAAPGTSALYTRGDHVHPTDTSRYAAGNPGGYVSAAGAAAAAPVQSVNGGTGAITGLLASATASTTYYLQTNPASYQTAAQVTASLNPYATLSTLATSPSYANDAAAAIGGVAIGKFYRNGSVVQVRVA